MEKPVRVPLEVLIQLDPDLREGVASRVAGRRRATGVRWMAVEVQTARWSSDVTTMAATRAGLVA